MQTANERSAAAESIPAEILAWLIAKKKLRAHNVGLEESAEYLAGIGMPREKLRVIGIPIDLVFEKPLDRSQLRRGLDLDADSRVLPIAAGGYGLGPVEQLVRQLLTQKRTLAACGDCRKVGKAQKAS